MSVNGYPGQTENSCGTACGTRVGNRNSGFPNLLRLKVFTIGGVEN